MKVRVTSAAQTYEVDVSKPLEIGRQRPLPSNPKQLEPGPFTLADGRLVVAWNTEPDVSLEHARLEPLPGGRVRISNVSSRLPVGLSGGRPKLQPGDAVELAPPFTVELAGRNIIVGEARPDPDGLSRLLEATMAPTRMRALPRDARALPVLIGPQLDQLFGWLQTVMGVLQSTVGAADFEPKAAQALVEIVGLQSGRVLHFRDGGWHVEAAHGTGAGSDEWRPSTQVLTSLVGERRTLWMNADTDDLSGNSLSGVRRVVAAPLLDVNGDVIGALYGEHRGGRSARGGGDEKLEAILVELLACGVAAGVARRKQEQEALKSQTLFEQFFTVDLARELRDRPDLLQSRSAVVTVLFCDVRGFSRISEKREPAEVLGWIQDVLDNLSRCVLAQNGVLVDYVGDELMAMWGAPTPQNDHAARAVRAALAMVDRLDDLNRRWSGLLGGRPMDFGVGLNTGPTVVGNVGSGVKFKYGALGNTVNVASRCQGLTKYLGRRLLVTRPTREGLGDEFAVRRVCQTRVVNIEGPIDLYEVDTATPERREFFRASEEALVRLEGGDFAAAARLAGELLQRDQHRRDGPMLLILSRAAEALMRDGEGFDPVYVPAGK